MDRLTEIRDLIDRADDAYYNSGEAIMEDAVYDGLRDELRRLCPDDPRFQRVGAPVDATALPKAAHAIPMGSQNKAMNRDEFMAWVKAMTAALGREPKLHASLKMDGGSIGIEYRAGALTAALTRGDGNVGDVITSNARRFRGLPQKGVTLHGHPFDGYARCEAMLLVEDWQTKAAHFKNPRNGANGIINRDDGQFSELISPFCFRVHWADGREVADTETGISETIAAMGFLSPQWMTGTAEEVWGFYQRIHDGRDALPFWIDGVVVKIDDLAAQAELGESGGCPRGQVAIKFPPEGAETMLLGVDVSVGHTGAIAPTAVLAPAELGGTTVRAASLANYDQIAALDVAIGDTVLVERRGDVIPKIARVVRRADSRQAIPVPTNCPVCGTPVSRKTTASGKAGAVLFCLNDDCGSRAIGRIMCWISSLNILGVGDEVLEAMHAQLGVNDAADLYRLKDRRSELANLTVSGIRFGESRADRLITELEAKRHLTLEEFIGSLGLDGLAQTRVQRIREAVPGRMDTLEAWLSGALSGFAAEAGVPGMAARFVADLAKRRPLIEKLLAHGVAIRAAEPVVPKFVAADAKSFCLTGKFSHPKSFFQEKIAARGHIWKESVAKGLDYLVADDPASTSGKMGKARKLGIAIIGEAELLRLLGE